MQILRPSVNTFHSIDLMFVYRHYVYAALVIIPVLCASLNYIKDDGHYTASGPFCMLPLRPFWPRLALAWVPRYVIGITIVGLSIAVYLHVRNVYEGTSKSKWWALSSMMVPRESNAQESASVADDSFALRSALSDTFLRESSRDDTGMFSSDAGARRPSAASTFVGTSPDRTPKGEMASSNADTTASRQGPHRKSIVSIATSGSSSARRGQSVDTSQQEIDQIAPLPAQTRRASVRPSIARGSSGLSGISARTGSIRRMTPSIGNVRVPYVNRPRKVSAPMGIRSQRAIIRRHLRLTFIYPLVYILTWLTPFVLHCMQYKNYFAANAPFSLGLAATCFLTLMAAIDCGIFCYREKPWRHICGNESGGLLSSFCVWRRSGGGASDGGNEKHRKTSIWRTVGGGRVSSVDSDAEMTASRVYDEEKDVDDGPVDLFTAAASTTTRPSTQRNMTLSTIASTDCAPTPTVPAQTNELPRQQGGRFINFPSSVARKASATPRHVTRHSRRAFRSIRSGMSPSANGSSGARRSDGDQILSELAKDRLAKEQEDRRAAHLGAGGGWAAFVGRSSTNLHASGGSGGAEERHWWDRVRKDKDFGYDWSQGPSRRGTADTVPAVESNPCSPGEDPDEGRTDYIGAVLGREFKEPQSGEQKELDDQRVSRDAGRRGSSDDESKDESVAEIMKPFESIE